MATTQQPRHRSHEVERAQEMLRQPVVDGREVLVLIKQLKAERAFGTARKLLDHALHHPVQPLDAPLREIAQQLALCTYKDPDLPPDTRFDDAFAILNFYDPLEKTREQETLGLAGAIYKRKWEHGNHKQHLERSLAYYRRGYLLVKELGWEKDQGYNAINAAFVLDLLAFQEEGEARKAGSEASTAEVRRKEADTIRKDILEGLLPLFGKDLSWWFLVTLGEAWFGLGEYESALAMLLSANQLENVPDWERESTARQLACLLRLRTERGKQFKDERPEAERVLREFLGNDAAVASVLTGKIGLALSGGGFRASLYHIGVLARLAELDLLRHVEVLSCVSGGSIIGAHYYLEVRQLLENNLEAKISQKDYIKIVQNIEKDFLAGVQTNIRTSVVTNPWDDVRMIVSPDFSRTNRVGKLYEKRIYNRINDDKERRLNKLKIQPFGVDEPFSPKDHNWKRAAKVPILILNATALNTGHNWQFTASWMGEPPAGIDSEIDANYRLRRMYYDEAPEKFRNLRLGDAVAASSCVPGLFEPLALSGLYDKVTVHLVDGGVYDNQGTSGLLDQGCTVLLVSDASGHMPAQDEPSNGMLGVPLRANSILQVRVRSAQYHELDARSRSGLLQGLMYIHLKKELDVIPKGWIGCDEPTPKAKHAPVTSYGINKEYQALADIRTDLDSFTNNEAHALMLSGYRMTERFCPKVLPESTAAVSATWQFQRLDPVFSSESIDSELKRQLQVGAKNAFKVWMLSRHLQVGAAFIVVALIIGLVVFGWIPANWWSLLLKIIGGGVALYFLTILANWLSNGWVLRLIKHKKPHGIALGGVFLMAGVPLARLHLWIFDKIFLRIGRNFSQNNTPNIKGGNNESVY
jgi:predicted acylesterase/phospholipase RssA